MMARERRMATKQRRNEFLHKILMHLRLEKVQVQVPDQASDVDTLVE